MKTHDRAETHAPRGFAVNRGICNAPSLIARASAVRGYSLAETRLGVGDWQQTLPCVSAQCVGESACTAPAMRDTADSSVRVYADRGRSSTARAWPASSIRPRCIIAISSHTSCERQITGCRRGLPPCAPLTRDEAAFALEVALPPMAPMCAIHSLLPKTPLISDGT